MLPGGLNIGTHLRVHVAATRSYPSSPSPPAISGPAPVDWESRGEARRHLLGAVRALDALEQSLGAAHRVGNVLARSSADIGLDTSPATAATLGSTQEVNATLTSFTPYAPSWSGASSAAMVFDGEYNGDQGSGTLTFEVRTGGTYGEDNLRIRMKDTKGKNVEQLWVRASDPANTVYTFSNGLQFSLGSGDLKKNDTLTVDVSDIVGTRVDPDKPLDGVGDDDARLESALTVNPGSFTVNGIAIAVNAGDSLNDVLARITASAAGVTATFDVATERVQLTQKSSGSDHEILLGPDTSGFLAATKLAGATLSPGTDYEPETAMIDVAALSSVQSGSITVNGEIIAIDVASDSLQEVIDRINASEAGVVATLSASAQRVSISSVDVATSMVLDEGSTGLFSALNIASQTYPASELSERSSKSHSYRAADALQDVSGALHGLFTAGLVRSEPWLSPLQSQVKGVLGASVAMNGEQALSRMGLRISVQNDGDARLRVDDRSRRHFTRQLQRDVDPISQILLGRRGDSDGGLIAQLRAVLDSGLESLASTEGTGAFIDMVA